jgi:hypothetical protein
VEKELWFESRKKRLLQCVRDERDVEEGEGRRQSTYPFFFSSIASPSLADTEHCLAALQQQRRTLDAHLAYLAMGSVAMSDSSVL